jgi:hypothetical protein
MVSTRSREWFPDGPADGPGEASPTVPGVVSPAISAGASRPVSAGFPRLSGNGFPRVFLPSRGGFITPNPGVDLLGGLGGLKPPVFRGPSGPRFSRGLPPHLSRWGGYGYYNGLYGGYYKTTVTTVTENPVEGSRVGVEV